MKTTRRRRLAAALVSALALSPALVAAHDNIVVHRRLAELSVQQLGNPFFFPYTGDVREGSYGEDSRGAERPQGIPACLVWGTTICP